MYRSDKQRRAMFAHMGQAKGPGVITRGQSKFRALMRKHPLLTEVGIGIPVAAAGIYAARKLHSVSSIANWANKGGKIRRGLKGFALEAPGFIASDMAIRRVLGGPLKKREKSESALHGALGGMLGEAAYRTARKLPNPPTQLAGHYVGYYGINVLKRHPIVAAAGGLGAGVLSFATFSRDGKKRKK